LFPPTRDGSPFQGRSNFGNYRGVGEKKARTAGLCHGPTSFPLRTRNGLGIVTSNSARCRPGNPATPPVTSSTFALRGEGDLPELFPGVDDVLRCNGIPAASGAPRRKRGRGRRRGAEKHWKTASRSAIDIPRLPQRSSSPNFVGPQPIYPGFWTRITQKTASEKPQDRFFVSKPFKSDKQPGVSSTVES